MSIIVQLKKVNSLNKIVIALEYLIIIEKEFVMVYTTQKK